jgi:hypothetical protein
MLTVYQP